MRSLPPHHQLVLDTLKSIGGVATTYQIAANMTKLPAPVSLNGIGQTLAALARAGQIVEVCTRGRSGSDRLWRLVAAPAEQRGKGET